MTHHTSLKLNHFPQKLYGYFISRSMHFKPQQISADTNNNNDESSPRLASLSDDRTACRLCWRHQIKCLTFILLFYFYFTSKTTYLNIFGICRLSSCLFIWLLSYFAEYAPKQNCPSKRHKSVSARCSVFCQQRHHN